MKSEVTCAIIMPFKYRFVHSSAGENICQTSNGMVQWHHNHQPRWLRLDNKKFCVFATCVRKLVGELYHSSTFLNLRYLKAPTSVLLELMGFREGAKSKTNEFIE